MKGLKRPALVRALLAAASFLALAIIAGCASGYAEPFDFNNLVFDYFTVSGSDGKYVVITKHLVSQTDVRIPDTIYGIPVRETADSVFAGDGKIQTVSFGKNVVRIGSNSFGGCKNLRTVTFNAGITDVGEYAFKDCVSLPSITLPENLGSLGRGAFYGCTSLTEISVPQTIRKVGGMAFYNTAWLNAQSEQKFVSVGDGILIAYNGDKAEVKLPKSVRQIAGAFAGNIVVEKVTLNSGLISVGDRAFMSCTSLKSVSIPSSVTEIGSNAFYGCASLGKLTLGEGIQTIGQDAFTDCGAALYLKKSSAAEKYCIDNGLDYFGQ